MKCVFIDNVVKMFLHNVTVDLIYSNPLQEKEADMFLTFDAYGEKKEENEQKSWCHIIFQRCQLPFSYSHQRD